MVTHAKSQSIIWFRPLGRCYHLSSIFLNLSQSDISLDGQIDVFILEKCILNVDVFLLQTRNPSVLS